MKVFRIVRTVVRTTSIESARAWLLPRGRKLAGCLALLLSMSISGCGAMQTTVTRPQLQPTPTEPPFHTITQTFDRDFTLTLTITPDRAGTNLFTMQVFDHRGQPASHVEITLYTTMQDMLMGTDSVVLHADGSGQFSGTSDVLSMGGHWAVGITIQTLDHIVHKAGVRLFVSS
jgi:hypothetical protein